MKSKVKTLLLLSVLALALVPFGGGTGVASQGAGERVPPNETHVILNRKGEKVREYGPGEAKPRAVDCVQIKCPKALIKAARGKTVRCWNCDKD